MVQERGTRDETRTNPVELASERLARAGSVTFGLVSKAIVAVPTLGSKSGHSGFGSIPPRVSTNVGVVCDAVAAQNVNWAYKNQFVFVGITNAHRHGLQKGHP